jgi:hypothetical protein
MPHSNDIGVDLDNYLAALGKYNLAYGPQPQAAGSTGGQNFAVRSSTEAPGFGYVNPETNELFPLYPQEAGGAGGPPQDPFHDYLNSIGAKQQQLGWGRMGPDSPFGGSARLRGFGGDIDSGGGWLPGSTITNLGSGENLRQPGVDYLSGAKQGEEGFLPQAPYKYGQGVVGGYGSRPGYVDPGGHFLGYGSNADELFQNSAALQRRYYEQRYGGGGDTS